MDDLAHTITVKICALIAFILCIPYRIAAFGKTFGPYKIGKHCICFVLYIFPKATLGYYFF